TTWPRWYLRDLSPRRIVAVLRPRLSWSTKAGEKKLSAYRPPVMAAGGGYSLGGRPGRAPRPLAAEALASEQRHEAAGRDRPHVETRQRGRVGVLLAAGEKG